MGRRLALNLYLATCVLLVILLAVHVITPLVSGSIFAIALVLFGGAARGFRK